MKKRHPQIHPFLHSAALIEKHLESLLVPLNIRHRQALVLDYLKEVGPSSQRQLVGHFAVSPGTMSSMVYRLEMLGLLQRETDPADRRSDVVNITAEGVSAIEGVADIWCEGDKTVEDILGSEDSKLFFSLTKKLSRALGGGPPGKLK